MALVANEAQVIAPSPIAKDNPLQWELAPVTVVRPGGADQVIIGKRLAAVATLYAVPGDRIWIAAIPYAEVRRLYLVRGKKDFYIYLRDHMYSAMLGTTELILTPDFHSSNLDGVNLAAGVNSVPEKVLASIDFSSLNRPERDVRIDLAGGAPAGFWSLADDPTTAHFGSPAVEDEYFKGNTLHIIVRSGGGGHKGEFAIDLEANRLVESIIDGRHFDIQQRRHALSPPPS